MLDKDPPGRVLGRKLPPHRKGNPNLERVDAEVPELELHEKLVVVDLHAPVAGEYEVAGERPLETPRRLRVVVGDLERSGPQALRDRAFVPRVDPVK